MSLLPTDRVVRLAVTGLSGAGKTAFVTSLIHNLMSVPHRPALLPLLRVAAERRLIGARLELPEDLPQFPYKQAVAAMAAEPPRWPDSTTDLSEARIAIRYRPSGLIAGRLTDNALLTVVIVDYPGEWLLDLPLLETRFGEWSATTLNLARSEPRRALASAWLAHLDRHPPTDPADEAVARDGARLYAAYLQSCKRDAGLSLVQPGRFLLPGALAGDPRLDFYPMDVPLDGAGPPAGTLSALMHERYERYRREIVIPFYRDHFRRFERQIVLVDVLRALDRGPHAFADAERALTAVLGSFRFGRNHVLSWLLGRRIEKVLFAATKADHVTPGQFANLRQLLTEMMAGPGGEVRFSGAGMAVKVLAAARATEPGKASFEGRGLGVVRGTLVGESEAVNIFPGEVPPSPPPLERWDRGTETYPRFRPPPIAAAPVAGIPHIGLDDALEFLLGDRFL